MGLGSAANGQVSLQQARTAAENARALVRSGIDPITVIGRDAREKRDRGMPNFGAFADDYLASMQLLRMKQARYYRAWLPIHVPGLGIGANLLPA